MTREESIKWLKSLKAEIGKAEHRTLWHYAEAIDAERMKKKKNIFEHEVEDISTEMTDLMIDCFEL